MELQEKEEKDERHIGKLFKNNPKIKCIFHSRLNSHLDDRSKESILQAINPRI